MIGTPYRHVILTLITSCLLAACSSQESQDFSEPESMIFSVDLGSRANVISGNSIASYPFAVYSDMINIERTPESVFTNVHDATKVSYNQLSGLWSYNDIQYWFPGFQYSFVALHPAENQLLTGILYSRNNLKFTYNQPSDYKTAHDLLISTHRRNYEGGLTEPVRFNFSHILTNVNIVVSYRGLSSGPTSISIDDLIFKNIPLSSTYSIQPAPLVGTGKMTSDWVNDEGTQQGWSVVKRGDLKIQFSEEEQKVIKNYAAPVELFPSSDALFLLPKPDDSSYPTELVINFSTDTGKKDTLSAIIPGGWNPGSKLTLTLNINNGLVQVGVSIKEWEEGSNTVTPVPGH